MNREQWQSKLDQFTELPPLIDGKREPVGMRALVVDSPSAFAVANDAADTSSLPAKYEAGCCEWAIYPERGK